MTRASAGVGLKPSSIWSSRPSVVKPVEFLALRRMV
jgi:hypothetical protein